MVSVSENFKLSAQKNGRHIYCRIAAGKEIFLDDRIIEFDFDDIIHPEYYTIGTACANQFCFTVRFSGTLELRDIVEPFISFDNNEWCPLGIFYVTRRYVRGNYASIICYDKMYYLDEDYTPSAGITDTRALLADACGQAGIPCSDFGEKHGINDVPVNRSIRDIIGYVAAANGACAKISRSGALVLKPQLQKSGFYLNESSCFDINRNMLSSAVSKLIVVTDGEDIESGKGARTNSINLYCPFMTQTLADALTARFKEFVFYGADIEMQGFPFLEAGDIITLRETDNAEYPIVVSELEMHYDGALTAKLHSKNRSDSDILVHRSDLERSADELSVRLDSFCQQHTNDYALKISSETTVAQFTFNAKKSGAFVQLNVNVSVTASEDTVLSFLVYVNGVQLGAAAEHKLVGGRTELVNFFRPAADLPKGRNRITVRLRASGGTIGIATGQLTASVIGNGTPMWQ